MPKLYDDALKKLLRANTQDFVSLARKGLQVERLLSTELDAENIYADGLAKCRQEDGQAMLAHFEFQRKKDIHIGERLLEYAIRASRLNGYLPVLSCVIYLKKDGIVPISPFISKLPNDEEIIRFRYKSICLWEMTVEELLAMKLPGLLPLLPLAKDGNHREVVDIMIEGLVEAERTESLWMGYNLASKVFTGNENLQWLRRRFAVFNDFLQDSPIYQEFMAEAEAKAKALAKAEAEAKMAEVQAKAAKEIEKAAKEREKAAKEREKAAKEMETEKMQILSQTRQTLGRTLENLVSTRFPDLKALGRVCARDINDTSVLSDLLIKISVAQDSEEGRKILESYLETI